MKKEQDVQLKMLLAEISAENGGVEGRKFIESLAETVDYAIVNSRADALGRLIRLPHPPEWIFDAVHAILNDTREVANVPFHGSFNRQIGCLADEEANLMFALGERKNPKSVPVLIELAQHGSYDALTALGTIDDPRGIPVCLEFLDREIQQIKKAWTQIPWPPTTTAPSRQLLGALAALHAQAAVPALLEYLHDPDVITALGKLGDERAIEPLRQIVGHGGEIENEPNPRASQNQNRLFAAKAALIRLEKEDPVPRWIELLKGPSLTASQRSDVADEFRSHPDHRAIEPLLDLIRSNPPRSVCRTAIFTLSTYPYKRVVTGLIACFDISFRKLTGGQSPLVMGDPLEEIGSALHKLTDKDFGADKTLWKKWWDDEGENLPTLQ